MPAWAVRVGTGVPGILGTRRGRGPVVNLQNGAGPSLQPCGPQGTLLSRRETVCKAPLCCRRETVSRPSRAQAQRFYPWVVDAVVLLGLMPLALVIRCLRRSCWADDSLAYVPFHMIVK